MSHEGAVSRDYHNRMLIGLARLALLGVLTGMMAPPGSAAEQCWAPKQQLSKGAGEAAIGPRGGINAYRPLPKGQLRIPGNLRPRGQVLRRFEMPPGEKVVALTFDLCEQPYEITGYQGDVVDYLRKENIRATFFAGGKWIVTHPERAQQILSDPLFEMANHSWEHRNLAILGREQMTAEVVGAQLAYQNAYDDLKRRACIGRAGKTPAYLNAPPEQRLFRFPFGACTREAIDVVERHGLTAVQWDVSSSDPWKGQTVDGQVKAVLTGVKSGSIVLFHANGRGYRTAAALPRIVEALRAEGYRFLRVGDLMAHPGARPVFASACYDHHKGDVDRYLPLARNLERQYQAFYESHGVQPPSPPAAAVGNEPPRSPSPKAISAPPAKPNLSPGVMDVTPNVSDQQLGKGLPASASPDGFVARIGEQPAANELPINNRAEDDPSSRVREFSPPRNIFSDH